MFMTHNHVLFSCLLHGTTSKDARFVDTSGCVRHRNIHFAYHHFDSGFLFNIIQRLFLSRINQIEKNFFMLLSKTLILSNNFFAIY